MAAFAIDIVPAVIVLVIGGVIGNIAGDCALVPADAPDLGHCGWAVSPNGDTLLAMAFMIALACYALALAYLGWNYGYRQGRTGSSIGKSVLRFKVVSDKTWQPIGFGQSLVRQIIHLFVDTACYVGFLWPLWDSRRQTWADKIMSTVCVPVQFVLPTE